MKEFLSEIFGLAFVNGFIFLVSSVVLYYFPPKKLNAWIGYRTAASLRSQERWDFAQKFSALARIKAALAIMIVSLTGYLFQEGSTFRLYGSILITICLIRYVAITTDRAIKKRFNTSKPQLHVD